MRSGGFPCRFNGCHEAFAVQDQSSMPALMAASARRSEHELSAHGYTHVPLEEHRRSPYPGVAMPRRGPEPTR